MVAPGAARALLIAVAPQERCHPWDLYWIWVFSTEKRWWQEARARFLFNAGAEHMERLQVQRVELQAEPCSVAVTVDFVGRVDE
jgi:hypothetical protein